MSQLLPPADTTPRAPMSEKELKAFVDATIRLFEKVTSEPAEVGAAAIHLSKPPVLDFSGMVIVAGACSGCVYVTLPREMLSKMMTSMGEQDPDDDLRRDFAGEIANMLAGNARRIFGESYEIATPVTLDTSAANQLSFAHASFVLPVVWRGDEAFIVIALKAN